MLLPLRMPSKLWTTWTMSSNNLPARTLFIATIIGIAHVVCGIAVIWAPTALYSTPLAFLTTLTGHTVYIGPGLIAVGLFAILGGSKYPGAKWQLIFISPQQLVLALQILSISIALVTGVYPDGYRPSGGAWFIIADQIWAWLFAVIHTVEVFGLAVSRRI